ncbi:MAG: histidine phosphatase family protein [Pseudomonadota bacterium]
MGQIYLIRHGQASFGSDDYDQLSSIGHEQGRELGLWFEKNGYQFDRVVMGNLKRHRQTVEACMSSMSGTSVVESGWETDPGFNEFDHHETMLRHWPDFAEPGAIRRFFEDQEKAKYLFQDIIEGAMQRWIGGDHDADYREPWPVFSRRCNYAFQRLLAEAKPTQRIAVFTSGGPISSIVQQILGLDDKHMLELSWSIMNCSVTKILYRSGKASLSYFNSYAHLEGSRQAGFVTYR